MQWDKLSMADRAKYIKLGVQNGITDLPTIRDAYNKFAGGGPLPMEGLVPPEVQMGLAQDPQAQEIYREYVENSPRGKQLWSNETNETIKTIGSFLPLFGTLMDIDEAIEEPSAENIGFATGSVISDLLGGYFIKGGARAIRAGRAARRTKLLAPKTRPLDAIPPEYVLGTGVYGIDAEVNALQQARSKEK